MINGKTTLSELAFMVSQKLLDSGINAVLTGGAVVSIYTKNRYESSDLDFVTEASVKRIETALRDIGFVKTEGRHFVHAKSKYFVEFVPAPLAIGDEQVKETAEISRRGQKLILLPPTYSVMDRLAAYFYWNDPQGLEQALMVAKGQPIDMNKIKIWAIKEGAKDKFEIFLKRLKAILKGA